MKKRVQSSRLCRPWGFFILLGFTQRRIRLVLASLATLFLAVGLAHAEGLDQTGMKRRQQGILTGMPFMSNLAPRTFVDDLGRKVYLAKPPQRIVSLAPSITEILYAIGAGYAVVGVTEFCNYPPEARTKPQIGNSRPNLEAIVSLNPDLILGLRVVRTDVLDKLEQLKVPLFVMDARSIEDIFSHIQTVGRMLNRSVESLALATSMRQQMQVITARTKSLPRRRVLYVVYNEPFITVGAGSFIHQLIELAGGDNVAAHAGTAYPRLSMEVVVREDPELLVFPSHIMDALSTERAYWQRWPTLSAVKADAFHQVPSDLLSRPGPRVVQGLEILAKLIHPEVFVAKGSGE